MIQESILEQEVGLEPARPVQERFLQVSHQVARPVLFLNSKELSTQPQEAALSPDHETQPQIPLN